MTAPLIKVTPEQLQSVAGQLAAGAAQIETTLGQLAGQVAPLGSDWAGGAQQRFETLWAEWQSSARNLHQALEGTSTMMRGAGTSFATHDSEVAATFNRGV